jgi:hypothetical protein
MTPALLAAVLAAPAADFGSALSSALGCLISILLLTAIPLAAYAALQIRRRVGHAGREPGDQVNFRQLGKTPVNGSTPNGGGNP